MWVSAWLTVAFQLCLVGVPLSHHQLISVATAQTPGSEGEKNNCQIVLDKDTQKKFDESNKVCFKEVGPINYTSPTLNLTLDEYHELDDKCFFECVYKRLGLVNDAGDMKQKGVEIIFKSNMTEAMMAKAVDYWDKCIVEAGAVVKARGSTSCKGIHLHMFCFTKKLEDEKFFRNLMMFFLELLTNFEDGDTLPLDSEEETEAEETTIIALGE